MKILIADDEPRHLRGMAGMIRGMRPDAEVLTAKDGLAALAAVRSERPDVVLTDIQMPNMDGLTFLKLLENEEGKRPKVVMVSAYNLFEYAQNAIRHGAYDYLLKPIDADKLEDIIIRLEDLLALEDRQFNETQELKQRLDITSAAHRSRLLLSWISGNAGDEERGELETAGVLQGPGVVVFSELRLHRGEGNVRMQQWLQQLKQVWTSLGEADTFGLAAREEAVEQAVTILRFPDPKRLRREELAPLLLAFRQNWIITGSVTHGISRLCESLFTEAPAAYRLAQTAHLYTFHDSWEGFVLHGELRPDNTSSFLLDAEQLFEALQDNDPAAAIGQCRHAFEVLAGGGHTDPQLIREYAALTIMKVKSRTRGVVDRQLGNVLTDAAIMDIPSCPAFTGLMALLTDRLLQMHHALRQIRQGKSELVIDHFMGFIQEHYMEDVTLEMAAEQFSFNASYFSTLIKSRTGRSFSEHITEARMRKAKELLAAGDLKIYEISVRCGYRDTKYFCRIFKKQHGISPDAYRHLCLPPNAK